MARYRSNLVPGATFFTVSLADRRSTCLTSHVTDLREAFRKARAERPFDIDAIVILPEHLHAVMTLPANDADFSHRWRRIKTVFAHALIRDGIAPPRRDGTGRQVWQRRFWEHTIRDEADLSRRVDYIHYNPVKHGLVAEPASWPHSSLHRFVRAGILPPDWGRSPPGRSVRRAVNGGSFARRRVASRLEESPAWQRAMRATLACCSYDTSALLLVEFSSYSFDNK